jgi:formylglycine-generating enzyme required for sulfatase activity
LLSAGDRIGDWVVEESLGEGGMGAVYRVHSALTERLQAALKILKTRPDPEERARFVREAESLSALSHPGIVRVMAFGEDPTRGLPYLAMELAIGETLKQRLARGPLSPAEAVTAFAPLASALEHAHASGIYHRDVKPANVVLCRDGSVKLVDFGIATSDDWGDVDAGGHLGTLPYLPPEIFRGEQPSPEAIDVYGVGLMLYEALTGTRPFAVPPGLTPAQVAQAIGARKLEQQSFDLGENVPAALRGAVLQATHPLPAERPSMRVLREAIDSLRAAISDRRGRAAAPLAPVRKASPAPPKVEDRTMRVPEPPKPAVNEPIRPWRARRARTRKLAILAGIAVLVLAAIAIAIAKRPRRDASGAPSATATPPPAKEPRKAGDTWVNPKDGLTSLWLPAGKFTMGCTPGDDRCDPAQLPSREITFDTGFWLSRTEVTVAAYKTFARQTATRLPEAPAFNEGWQKDDHPMVNVTWDDARAYCAWTGGRLPSEAEWEYAARGGHADWFHPWGRESPTCTPGAANGARFDDGASCRKAGTERVGVYGPNGFGLVDVAGNAWEWCADEWNANYSDAPSDGSAFEEGSSASRRVLRGGSWINGADYLRVSIRSRWFQSRGRDFIGFRCARDGEEHP